MLKGFDNINMRTLQRYTSPQAIKDFDKFMDDMPTNVGYNALIAAGLAWLIAGASVVFTAIEIGKVTGLRTEMMKIETLQPSIPVLKYTPVGKTEIDNIGKKIEETYFGVKVISSAEGEATVSAADTDNWPQFMAAINTLENGAKNWKVKFSTLCVGRDCAGSKLSAVVKIDYVRIDQPSVIPDAKPDDGTGAVPPPAASGDTQ